MQDFKFRIGAARRLRAFLFAASAVAGDFDTGANWNPAAVPTGTAFFGTSSVTSLSFSTNTTIGGWTFNAERSAYTKQ